MRQSRYQAIADDLRSRLEAGEFPAGRLLPSESELSGAYASSRVTIRRALDELRSEGLLDARQGVGWFAASDPLRQNLARLGTIEGQLAEEGRRSERRVLDFGFVAAPVEVRRVLGSHRVLEVRRLNLADGAPFARVTVWCPESLAHDLSRADVEGASFLELLPLPVGGARQSIGAAAASDDDAALLEVPVGSPVLVCRRTTFAASGEPILHSEFVFPGHLTEFVVELPRAGSSMAPSGLRLVE